jgi:ubiquitin-protein ligase
MADKQNVFMQNFNRKRFLKDVADVIKNPLTDNGIFYTHDEDNMMRGYALVFGPSDTIYKYGSYLFVFDFPKEYPFKPPKLTFMTHDGVTRFHPNLYKSGKVCLSLLNTWDGEQWTACQSIRTVLLTLVTLFHDNPLANEPNLVLTDMKIKKYNKIIAYSNYKVAITDMLNRKRLPKQFVGFFPIIKKHCMKNKENILLELEKMIAGGDDNVYYNMSLYNMRCVLNYSKLKKELTDIFEQ